MIHHEIWPPLEGAAVKVAIHATEPVAIINVQSLSLRHLSSLLGLFDSNADDP